MDYIIYKGNKYTVREGGYYRKTSGDRKLLHRQIWEDNYGEISSEIVIHHKDGNPSNNDISNLEAMTQSEHASTHQPMPDDGLSQYQRFYYKHQEQDLERARNYYRNHKEERVDYSRKYRQEHREEINQRRRERYRAKVDIDRNT